MGTDSTTTAVGIDVSKDTLDACLLSPDGTSRAKAFPNAPAGFAALLAWADGHADGAAHFGMEATGGYEDALATALHAAGRVVSVINPTRVKYAGIVRGRGNKTDKADARLIAAYTAPVTDRGAYVVGGPSVESCGVACWRETGTTT